MDLDGFELPLNTNLIRAPSGDHRVGVAPPTRFARPRDYFFIGVDWRLEIGMEKNKTETSVPTPDQTQFGLNLDTQEVFFRFDD